MKHAPNGISTDLSRHVIAAVQIKNAIELGNNRNDRVWAVVREIPSGVVATYGQIATLAGITGRSGARQVGYALAALPKSSKVPWHRVINAKGSLSPRADPDAVEFQQVLLESEGVDFDHRRWIDLGRYGWNPKK